MNTSIITHAANIYTNLLHNPEFWVSWIENERVDCRDQKVEQKLSLAAHLLAASFGDFTSNLMAHVKASQETAQALEATGGIVSE